VLQVNSGLHAKTSACCHLALYNMASSKSMVWSCVDIRKEHIRVINARYPFWCVLAKADDHDGGVCVPDAGGGVAQR